MIYTSWQFTCHLQADSSADPCSELYHGPSASSELEVQAITDYFWNNKPVIGAIDFHSYYQEILYPPGIQLVKLSFRAVTIPSRWCDGQGACKSNLADSLVLGNKVLVSFWPRPWPGNEATKCLGMCRKQVIFVFNNHCFFFHWLRYWLQWNPSITDTIGNQHFVPYSKVSLTHGLPVYFW